MYLVQGEVTMYPLSMKLFPIIINSFASTGLKFHLILVKKMSEHVLFYFVRLVLQALSAFCRK